MIWGYHYFWKHPYIIWIKYSDGFGTNGGFFLLHLSRHKMRLFCWKSQGRKFCKFAHGMDELQCAPDLRSWKVFVAEDLTPKNRGFERLILIFLSEIQCIWSNYSEGLGPSLPGATLAPLVLVRIGPWHLVCSFLMILVIMMFSVHMVVNYLQVDAICWWTLGLENSLKIPSSS